MKSKKGRLNPVTIFMLVAVFAVGIAITSYVLNSIQGTQTANSTVWNVTSDAISGFSTFGSLLPAIIVLAFAFLVIFILMQIKGSVSGRRF